MIHIASFLIILDPLSLGLSFCHFLSRRIAIILVFLV